MKIRAFVVLVLALCGIAAAVWAAGAVRPSGPQKGITEAIETKNTPLLIRSLITNLKDQAEKDAASLPEMIRKVEAYTAACPDSAGVAVLHSMLAEMYQMYYRQNAWTIRQRTPLDGYVPDDIREWTANLFEQKTGEELAASLRPASLLQQTPVSTFDPILIQGKNTAGLRPTLYDFLVYRAIDIQPEDRWYEDLLAFRRGQSDRKAYLTDELAYLRFREQNGKVTQAAYQAALDSLSRVYEGEKFSIEIRLARLSFLEQSQYSGDSITRDSIRTAIYRLTREGIAAYPDNPQTNVLRNALARLEQPALNAETPNNVYPGKNLTIRLKYTNIPQVRLRIYRSLRAPASVQNLYGESKKNTRGTLVREQAYRLAVRNSYTEADTVLTIPMEELGLYEYVLSVPGKNILVSSLFSVSRLATLVRTGAGGTAEVLVTDYESGRPLDRTTVYYYVDGRNGTNVQPKGQVETDHEGLARVPDPSSGGYRVRPVRGDDRFSLATMIFPMGTYRPQQTDPVSVSLFTDRGIYRPGQTVFFKGIAYLQNEENPHVVVGRSIRVSLYGANGEEIANKTFTTNAFGSFDGEFVLPKQTLNGTFRLQAENTRNFIRVEAYKRPTFEVSVLPVKMEVSFGQPVKIEGKAQTYSGVALQTGRVNWKIVRQPFWLRYFFTLPRPEQVAAGTASVDDRGRFSFMFTPEKTNRTPAVQQYQTYEVTVTLTDGKGETQEARYTFNVGDRGILLTSDLPAQLDKDTTRVTVGARTLNGDKVTVSGTYTIRPEKGAPAVAQGRFTAGEPLPAGVFAGLPSGSYLFEAEAKDKQGREVSFEREFVLYGTDDKRPPVFRHIWLLTQKTRCLPGEEAEFVFGTSDKDAHILYEVYSEETAPSGFTSATRLVSRHYLKLNDENRRFRIPFKAEYGAGMVVSFTFVKAGELYVTQVPVYRAYPDRKLTIRPETFRDRLTPGSRENWKFRIVDADSSHVSAEVLAGMYDASLDQLQPFRWAFSPFYQPALQAPSFNAGIPFHTTYKGADQRIVRLKVPEYTYDRLNWQGVFGMTRRGVFPLYARQANGIAMKSEAVADVATEGLAEPVVVTEEEQSGARLNQTETGGQYPPVQIRENLAETAFFYPALMTGADGDVAFGFTMPESNTTWKLQMLAQTKDLKYGYLSKEIITNKPLMVLPNLPRFLRQGDVVTLQTQIINQSKDIQQGRASLELFDPSDNQPVVCLTKSQKPFTLAPDSTGTVSWTITVPDYTGLLGCRIVAEADHGSDGEQQWLPVLPDEILLTQSVPFYLYETDRKEIRLPENKASRPFRLSLELSANPVWYAVQALPTLTAPEHADILSIFASYYSNTLAAYIARSHPRIQRMIREWSAQGGDASTLLSNLEKNEELKNILIEETPWVLEARNETEQKQRLSLLFDLNRAEGQREAALQQLLRQQRPEGGWSWFEGFPASRTITQSILKGMSRLVQLGAVEYNQEEKEMQIKALNFLDRRIQEDYEALKKQAKRLGNTRPSTDQTDYLFVRSAYRDIPERGESREAIRFYTGQARKYWKDESLYGKGEIALLMHRNGDRQTADAILGWLRKTATTRPDEGMFWANNRQEYNGFVSPVETQCLLMEVFHELAPDRQRTDRMKQWLLNRKQTRNWPSVPATVDAIYALLLTGSDWLNETNTVTVEWGGRTFRTDSGIGYLKQAIDRDAITPAFSTLTVRKEGTAPAWGAVYEQSFQPLDQVSSRKGVLGVEKKLFVETSSGADTRLVPVTPERPLRVGDKVVVRLTVRADRPMDYVYLKDLRAACFEPADPLSGSRFRDGVWFYRSPLDISENFFFDRLPQGTFVLEYAVYVARTGEYAGGISTIQSLYAPEFTSNTEGNRVVVR